MPLQGYSISFVGRLSKRPRTLKEQIENLGGTTTRTIDRSLDVIISTQGKLDPIILHSLSSFLDQINNGHRKIQQAQSLDIHVVPEEFLDEVLNDRPSIVMEKLKLSSWGVLPHIRKSQNPAKKRKLSSTSKSTSALLDEDFSLFTGVPFLPGRSKKCIPEKMTMKLKDGFAVDPDSGMLFVFFSVSTIRIIEIECHLGLEETCHVLKDEATNEMFAAVLGRVDITCGTNSYYKIQLLKSDTNKEQWFVFRA